MNVVSFTRPPSSLLRMKPQAANGPAGRDCNFPIADGISKQIAKTDRSGEKQSRHAAQLQALVRGWIAAGAAITFLLALVLSALQLISLMQLFYVYAGITAVTLFLGVLLYLARPEA